MQPHLPPFPYDEPLEAAISGFDLNTRPWSLRLDVDYTNNFDRLDSVGGHFLLETASRFGLDAAACQLQERLPGGQRDRLCLGDANLVFRFAQSNWAEFRAGLGANWLADEHDTDFGFNFNYAADIFPYKPFVLSSAIDCGTLGHAGLFRFRTTVGVAFHGVEAYTGYEYLDVERAHYNAWVTGLRFWF